MTAPVLTGFQPTLTFNENTVNAAPQLLDADVNFSDLEGDFNGGVLSLSGLLAEDRVSVRNEGTDAGQIGLSGADVTYGGVVIGALVGGSGGTLTITFNANATSAAIDALIQNLTYANVSGNPTANRTLILNVVDAAGQGLGTAAGAMATFAQRSGSSLNPFENISTGAGMAPTFADLDGDGDQDMAVGSSNGSIRYFTNVSGVFTEQSSPFGALNNVYGGWVDPTFADVDGDGDFDMVAMTRTNGGYGYGYSYGYSIRTAINTNGSFAIGSSPFDQNSLDYRARPSLVDLDGDGDLDLIRSDYGSIRYFRNTGGALTEQGGGANPFNGISITNPSTAFADLDGDGDQDMVVADRSGTIRTYRNDGASFTQLTGSANPFNGVNGGYRSNPAFSDVDGDGDQDLVIGSDYDLRYYLNTTVRGVTTTVTVTAQADAIVASGLPTDVAVLEDTASNLDLSALSLSDPDVVGAVTVVLTASAGVMTAVSGGGVTVSGSASGVLTLVGTAGAIDTWLNTASNVRYTSALNVNGDDAATITVTADDGSGVVTIGVVNVDIANTTEAPVLTGLDASVTFDEATVNATAQLLDIDVSFSDFEDTFDGGSLRLTGLLAEDRVSVNNEGADAGQIGVSGSIISFGGVVIGTLAGGSGSTLTITFNAAATAEAINALIQNLAYANVSDNPTASRDLRLDVIDANGQGLVPAGPQTFVEQTGAANTFSEISVSNLTGIALGDLDGDGDDDVVTGDIFGNLAFFANSNGVFSSITGAASPGNGRSFGYLSSPDPALIDIDSDGDLDVVIGANGTLRTLRNNGGSFTELIGASNPFNGISNSGFAFQTFADIDADGDKDLVFSSSSGLRYFRNSGNVFTEQTGAANPLSGFSFSGSKPANFVDLDRDGDLDVVIGQQDGTLRSYENTGSGYVEMTGAANPFSGLNLGSGERPEFRDLDGDGDFDLVSATSNGQIRHFLNTSPTPPTIRVNVTPVNDAIVTSGLPTDVSVVEDEASPLDLSALSLSDPDVVGNITVVLTASAGALHANNGGGVAVSGSATGTLTLVGTAGAINAWLNVASNVRYTSELDVNGADAATITVTADDGSGVVTIGTVNVDIANSTEAPVLADIDTALTFEENTVNGTPQRLDVDVSFSDFEDEFDGGSLVISGLLTEDRVSVNNEGTDAGQIGLSGSNVTFGGVVIGTLGGGSGSTLTITFNAAATAEAIEALIENLTYANVSDAPTATRTLSLNVFDADGRSITDATTPELMEFAARTGAANPFNNLTFSSSTAPTFGDLDGDGDLDFVIGNYNGTLQYFTNSGGVFSERTGGANPFSGIDVGNWANPVLVDLDADGDLDLVATAQGGSMRNYLNANGVFSDAGAQNPFASITNGYRASPDFLDLDSDGDLDLVVGSDNGLRSFINTGGVFSEATGSANPFNGLALTNSPAATFIDFDRDGDQDMVLGFEGYTALRSFENVNGVFTEVTGADNPFNGLGSLESRSMPTFADVDQDGDLDLVVAVQTSNGRFTYYENTGGGGLDITVGVTAQNDALTHSGLPTDIAVIEETAGLVNLSALTLSDPDVTGSVTMVLTASEGTLTAASAGGVTVTGSASGALTLVGTASAIDAFLNNTSAVSYTGALDVQGQDAATITVTVEEGEGPVTLGVVNVDITNTTEAPILTGLASAVTFGENTVNATPQRLDVDVSFSDFEDTFDGGSLRLTGLLAEDRVSVNNEGVEAGQIGLSGANVTFGGVVIGTLAGGAGSSLAITFNAAATAEAIEALVENLTYANVSNTPTATRNLSLNITDADGQNIGGTASSGTTTFSQQTGSGNPFSGVSLGGNGANSVFYDFDSDGDQDMLATDSGGSVRAYRNDGGTAFTQVTGAAHPFNGLSLSSWADLAIGDIDGDGDLDLVSSGYRGTYGNYGYRLRTFVSNGNGDYTERSTSGVSNVSTNYRANPTMADLDGDGDADLVVGNYGSMRFFRNNGDGTFSEQGGSGNPLNGVNFGDRAALAFTDLDGDGDLDAVAGQTGGTFRTFRNNGSGSWSELTGSANPFNGAAAGSSRANPSFVDVDRDGDMDMVVGSDNGQFSYFLNTTPRGQRITVNVTSQNDAVTHSGLPTDVAATEEIATIVNLSALTLTDPDVTASISMVLTASEGTLAAASGGGVTVTGSASGALTLTGTAAAIDAFLNNASAVRYTGALDDQGDNAATITVTVEEGDGPVTLGVVNVDIANTLEAPILTGLTTSVTFGENTVNATPQRLDVDVAFSDFEGTFNGGALRVSGLLTEDRVSVNNEGVEAGQIGLSGSSVTFGGVVIGTLAGGSGATLTITFNAAATTEAVDALIQNLTYANVSHTPTASRNLAVNVSDADGLSIGGTGSAGAVTFVQQSGAANPFNGFSFSNGYVAPVFGDLDGDGDQDMLVGGWNGQFRAFGNTNGVFTELSGSARPFNGLDVYYYSDPALIDLDGDGDLDMVTSNNQGDLRTFRNNGGGGYTELTGASDPFAAISSHYRASPTFVDFDGDGDLDLIQSNGGGGMWGGVSELRYFRNDLGAFTEQTGGANPFNGVNFGSQASPAFIDLDGDGDLDAVVGQYNSGALRSFRNNGAGSWTELTGSANPFNGVNVSSRGAPTFGDVDGDGDLDLVVGSNGGQLTYLINTTPRGQIVTVNVTSENDALTHSGLPTDVTVTEEIASNVNLSALTLTDLDTGATLTLTLTASEGVLTATGSAGVTVSGSGSGALTLTGTTAAIDAWLNTASNIRYTGAEDADGQDVATITVTAMEGSDPTVIEIGVVNVDISNTTEAPDLTDFGPSATFDENTVNGSPQRLDIDVSFSDFEDTFDGGSLRLTGLLAEDRVSVNNEGVEAGQIGLSGSNVTFGGVVIGTLAGGSGSTLTITFNAAANAEAIEALVENLTYANVSDNPTATRNLSLNITDADGQNIGGTSSSDSATFSQQTGSGNPFSGIGLGSGANSVFYDFDGDGDRDMLATDSGGSVRAYRNDGGTSFTQVTGAAHPFNGLSLSSWADLAVGDIDGDGDMDLVSSGQHSYGGYRLRTFVSNGSGSFSERSTSGVSNVSTNYRANPTMADLDGDGDADLVVGNYGSMRFFRNNGDGTFTEQGGSSNPLNGVNFGDRPALAFTDLDGDGDLDAVAGQTGGTFRTFRNNGSGSWSELTGSANPFNGAAAGSSRANPSFVDVDGDGDMDMVVGSDNGQFSYFLNTTPRGQTITVNVTAGDDAISAAGVPTDRGFVEDVAGNLDLSSITLTDPDVTGNITVVLTADAGTLTALTGGGVTVTGSASGTLTLTGTAAAIDAFLNTATNIRYTGSANANGGDVAAVTITANGGAGFVTLGVVNIDITPVNDAPTVSGLVGAANFIEGDVNGAAQLIGFDVTFQDIENNLDGGTLTLSGLLAEDRIAVRNEGTGAGQIGVAGSAVTFGGVVIGTLSGGSGTTLTVTLNAAADSAAVEALIQNLTYSNVSDNPTSSRTLVLNVTDAAGMSLTGAGQGAVFNQLIGASNPFANFPINLTNTQSLVDLDRDGDMDIVAGDSNGTLRYYLNANGTFAEQTGAANPFNGIDVGSWSDPAFADLDGDGDLDMVTGDSSGALRSFRNDGSAFSEMTGAANPFNGVNGGYRAAPTFQDIDGDGDLDLIVNSGSGGTPLYFQNATPRPSVSSVIINVAAQNDAPRVDGAPTDIVVTGDVSGQLDLSALTFSDVDSAGVLTLVLTASAGSMAAASGAGVTVTGSGTQSLTLVGTAAAIEAWLNVASNIAYTGTADASGDNVATLTLTANDGSGPVTLAVMNIDLTAVNDVMTGTAGADTLTGLRGDDVLRGGAGNDVLNGGAGRDTGDYSTAAAGVQARLASNSAAIDGDGGSDTFISIENLTGSAFDDLLIGDAGANVLSGGLGNDILLGMGGDDTLIGGAGVPNTLQGGQGNDTYVVTANDTITEFANEGVDTVLIAHNYTLRAHVENLVFTGAGAFRGVGNAENNSMTGGAGDDVLAGLGGVDVLTGGAGLDTADYGVAISGVVANLATGAVSADGHGSTDTLVSIENLIGSAHADVLTGTAGANILNGGSGNDRLLGGAGADQLIGGLGVDTADYSDAAGGVTAKLSLRQTENDGSGATDTLSGIENLTGSAFNDLLVGDAGVNTIAGGLGADILLGLDGNDVLLGGAGAANTLYGGLGDDTFVVDANDTIVELAGQGTDTVQTTRGYYVLKAEIENLTFTGSGAFSGTGNAAANVITGGAGADVLIGGGGNDTLNGGGGVDHVYVSGVLADYTITDLGGGAYRITDSVSGRDGVDVTADVERIRFSDGTTATLSSLAVAPAPVLAPAKASDDREVLPDFDGDDFLLAPDLDLPTLVPTDFAVWTGQTGDAAEALSPFEVDAFVLPALPDDQPLVLPGVETGDWVLKGAFDPLVLPGEERGSPLFLNLEARSPFDHHDSVADWLGQPSNPHAFKELGWLE